MELGLIAGVAKLFGAVGHPAGTEKLAALSADELGKSARAVSRNEQDTFHEALLVQNAELQFNNYINAQGLGVKLVFGLLNTNSDFSTGRTKRRCGCQLGEEPEGEGRGFATAGSAFPEVKRKLPR